MKGQIRSIVNAFVLTIVLAFVGTLTPIAVPTIYAQQVTGGIQGTVADTQGAVISGAEISVKNINTGAEAATTTNESGLYRLPALSPGTYTVTVMAPGFKKVETTQVLVKLGLDSEVNASLEVGNVGDIVEVTGSTDVVIERNSAQISGNFEARKVAELPTSVAGGGVDAIALLTPGVVGTGDAGFSNTNGTSISANGGRGRSNNFSIDGQDNNDISVAGPAVGVDNADIVQEFQIVTNNFSAEYGQAGSSIVNIVTKGGSNDFHGTVSEFYRNQKLFDTLDSIERRTGLKEAPGRFNNTFGGTLGGRLIKDKLLFFGSYQGIRDRQSSLVQSDGGGLTLTPNGISTALQFVTDPAIRNAINVLAPFNRSLGSPVVRPDVPTRLIAVKIGNNMVPLEFGAIQRNISTPFGENFSTFRIDYNVSDKLRIFGRYLYQKGEPVNATGRGTSGFLADVPSRSQQMGATIIYNISPRIVNEFRVNYSRLRVNFGGGTGGIDTPTNAPQALTNINMPTGFLAFGIPNNLPQARINDNYQFLDNFSVSLGKHSLKMGVDFKRRLTDSNFLPNQNGSFTFRTLTKFFNNTPDTVALAIGPNVINFTEFDQAYYFEDSYKVKDNLTLSLGVRYENAGQPINILNQITSKREADPTTAIFDQKLPLDQRVFPGVDTDNNNFAPRVGFAYTPKFAKKLLGENKTVVRGGFGISYDLAFYNILLNSAGASPVVLSQTLAGGSTPLPLDLTGTGVRNVVGKIFPIGKIDPRRLSRTFVANDFHSPYTEQFSLGVQRQIGNSTVAEVRYVGTRGVGLFQSINGNPRFDALAAAFPNLVPAGVKPSPDNGRLTTNQGLLRTRINGANSIYHSLQARVDTKIKTLVLGATYAYSKQIDNSSEIFSTSGGGNTFAFSQNPFDTNKGERGLGASDFRHVFTTNFLYDIPTLPGFSGSKGLVKQLVSGYEISGTFRAFSGQRYTPTQGFFNNSFTDLTFNGIEGLRPFGGNPNAPNGSVAIDAQTASDVFGIDPTQFPTSTGFYLLNSILDPNSSGPKSVALNQVRYIANTNVTARAFGTPFGTVGRNSAQGEDTYIGTFGFFKNTQLTEKIKLQFQVEMFNVFNHPNFGVPDPFIDDAGTTFADATQNAGGRRTVQFGLKLSF